MAASETHQQPTSSFVCAQNLVDNPSKPLSSSSDGLAAEEDGSDSKLASYSHAPDTTQNSRRPFKLSFRRISELHIRSTSLRGRTVVVSPLPKDMTMRDLVPRIRGTIVQATLAQFKDANTAVITFREPESAQRYKSFCDQLGGSLWALPPAKKASGVSKGPVDMPAATALLPKIRHEIQNDPSESLLSPHLCSPPHQLSLRDNATRCIVVKSLPLNKLPQVWSVFGFSHRLHVPHYRNQVEDIWLDCPTVQITDDKRIVHMDMHIWFTSINMAHAFGITHHHIGQRQGQMDSNPWNRSICFEKDPCSSRRTISDASNLTLAWSSHEHASLVSLHDLGQLEKLFDILQAIFYNQHARKPVDNETVDPASSSSNNYNYNYSISSRLPSMRQLQLGQVQRNLWQDQLKKFVEEETNDCAAAYCPGRELARRAHNNGFTTLQDQNHALHFHYHMLDIKQPKCFLSALDVFKSLAPSRSTYSPASATPESEGIDQAFSPCTDYELEMMTAIAAKKNQQENEAVVRTTTSPKAFPDYSRKNWETGMQAAKDRQDCYWTIGKAEYCAMTPEQLEEFGRPGYIPPSGFTTVKKNMIRRYDD
ncbi:hypothetical protein BD289DRAFT_451858 [Coniella lustricola]|uniref:RRM domain-containing protein n=1 Tax=Coniella lustricola TaxID=2025994 RepID=A0A2T3AD98_9PEZI|nr:hypothetical protein BD289DRAFT_451858 [Coniella lustricola]